MPALARMTIARASDTQLARWLEIDDLPEDEWEMIMDEIEAREEYRANHDDTPSLQDRGIQLGSYTE